MDTKNTDILMRRNRVAELMGKHYSQRRIQEQLASEGIERSIATVNGDVKAIRQEWQESRIVNHNHAVGPMIHHWQETARLARAEYEKTKDPQFLNVEQKALANIGKIYGVYAPDKVSAEVTSGESNVNLSKLTSTELELFAELQRKAQLEPND